MQQNAETGEGPKHHETESSKSNISDVLMTEQTEEHKHQDGESATTNVPGCPVITPVTAATIDVDSTCTPQKPESAQGFV